MILELCRHCPGQEGQGVELVNEPSLSFTVPGEGFYKGLFLVESAY